MRSYLAPSLERAAEDTPNATVRVIVQSEAGAADASSVLETYGAADSQLGIADASAGTIQASALDDLATQPGLVVTPDNPVALDAPGGQHDAKGASGSDPIWQKAVGVDQLWPEGLAPAGHRPSKDTVRRVSGPAPAIAFVDSGIQTGRADFGNRILAHVNLSSLPNNSPGDGFGHGTLIAGLAAGSNARYTGAAPTAGIVSLDVMDDNGMAKTSDVIRAAQWILANHVRYNIRVANFSLHSTTPSSFRWDPLDKAIEKLWFSGVVVVASAGNNADDGRRTRMGFAPANDPFAIAVGALDLHHSTNPDLTTVTPWSSWGYTFDGFAKPELSAPGRAITGPVPAGATLPSLKQFKRQVLKTPDGTYMTLSGTSLSAPIVSGIAADLLALDPSLTPDRVKGALMLGARPSPGRARSLTASARSTRRDRPRSTTRRTRTSRSSSSSCRIRPGTVSSSTTRPGSRRPPSRRRGTRSRGATAGSARPGRSSPGLMSPGATFPGATSPGRTSPGRTSPGATSSATSTRPLQVQVKAFLSEPVRWTAARAEPARPPWSAPPSRRVGRPHGQSPHGLHGRRRRVGALDGRTGRARTASMVGAAESARWTAARAEPARPPWSAPPSRRLS